ncbi:predicted protein [Verticillium alfalfae VaMs.102]|uniref:Predicted protein n=1 Tax=Verticillium alfalfae (strain VaMs.102 / ATCC MYA-4576 / FGSC 10136) TaxID=526221 RepID=C9SCJ3_VERA1|nr:predicted protein [Verticillium alfalfae VaMs.102]EEY16808.1 predicted protein [Verticillium alfalfae VaMs.102]
MTAPYVPLVSAASSPDADDDAKGFLSSQPSTTNNSTSASPAQNMSLAAAATLTPLSTSVDSSDRFCDPLATVKESQADSNAACGEQDAAARRVSGGARRGNAPGARP